MAWSFLQGAVAKAETALRLDLASDLSADEFLAPVMAGAYMRGLSDLLGLFDLAAVFLDRSGRILATNDSASQILKSDLRIESSHLVAGTTPDNVALSHLIDEAVRGCATAAAVVLGSGRVVMKVLPLPEAVSASPIAAILVAATGADLAGRALLDRLGNDGPRDLSR